MRECCLIAVVVLASGCHPFGEWEAQLDPIELGVDVRLDAVTSDNDRLYMIGAGGLVLDDRGNQSPLPATLRDIIFVGGDTNSDSRLIVVGAEGYVATARNSDLEFEVEAVGTEAELWAVAAVRDLAFRVVIVGDDALIVGREDEQGELVWTHPEAPPDGWGMLRDVSLDAGCAIGQAGRMVCTSDDLETWELVELDTDANLNSFCAYYSRDVVGDAGTLLSWTGDGWAVMQLQPSVDMLACTRFFYYHVIVGADRTIYQLNRELEPLLELDWQPRAVDPLLGTVIVGDDGHAGNFSIITGLVPQ
jgi:hypothetical protein